jgi:hypothetical protein
MQGHALTQLSELDELIDGEELLSDHHDPVHAGLQVSRIPIAAILASEDVAR